MTDKQSPFYEITVPELGESIVEATIIHWLKKEGDPIEAGDPVVELETSKVNLEVASVQAGILRQILHKENDDVKVGETLALVAPKGTGAPESAGAPEGAGAQRTADKPAVSQLPVETQDDRLTAHAQAAKGEGATPVARRMATSEGLDLAKIEGTGPGGRVAKTDVIQYLSNKTEAAPAITTGPAAVINNNSQAPKSTPAKPEQAPTAAVQQTQAGSSRWEERIKLSRRRRTIAERLVQAQQIAAMLTTFNELDMTRVMELRSRRNEALQAKHGIKLGIVSFFIKAAIGALKAVPQMNAEIQGSEMVLKHYYDIGIAVANPGGLVVPVVRDADRLSLIEIERHVRTFAEKADKGVLTLEDLSGGTFTITNGGTFGSMMSTPILTYPQVGILGLHKIEKRPVVVDDEIVIRPMMYAALTYDHRMVDGQEAVKFLSQIKTLIEDPEAMLLEV